MAANSYLHYLRRRAPVNGTHKLLRCWTPGVSKFTAGSFYNFEQDNLPLYDLEERTYFNWQNDGFPSLKPNSLHLLVSGDAPEELVNCNSNIFHTLQSAVDALPKNISINTRITVASYGNLGTLLLSNIGVDPSVKLEIVNLNYYDKPGIYPIDTSTGTDSSGENRNGKPYYYDALVSSVQTTNNQSAYGLYKGLKSFGSDEIGSDLLGNGGIADFLLRADVGNAAGYRPRVVNFDIDPYLASSVPGVLDERVTGNYTAFVSPLAGVGEVNGTIRSEIGRLSVGTVLFNYVGTSTQNGNINELGMELTLREESSEARDLVDYFIYDPSSFNQTTLAPTFRGSQPNIAQNHSTTNAAAVKATLYGNYLERAEFTNCAGRIHLTGFRFYGQYENPGIPGVLDAGTGNLPVGLKVDGCPNLFVESIAVSEYGEYGICLVNSKVTFERSLYIYRCYGRGPVANVLNPFQTPQIKSISYSDPYDLRLSKPWLENIQSLDAPVNDESAGLYAVNSQIEISDEETVFLNSQLANTLYNLDTVSASPFRSGDHNCKIISRCSTGIRLENSRFVGGQGPFLGRKSAADTSLKDYINVEGNANYGIHLIQSAFTFKGNTQVFQNTRGIRAENSRLVLDSFKIDRNHKYGLKLDDSQFTYGLVQVSSTTTPLLDFSNNQLYSDTNSKLYSFVFDTNGQHIIANNSLIKSGSFLDPKPEYCGRLIFINAHGVDDSGNPLPGNVLNNSEAEFVHALSLRQGLELGGQPTYLPGSHFLLTNNSSAKFLGSASAITCMASPGSESLQSLYKTIGLLAENNSNVTFRGPTVLYDAAVNVYVNNGSTVKFEPHKKDDGTYDTETFPLTEEQNHTMVEVKAIRSCLLADNNSNIIIEDLGNYSTNWNVDQINGTNYPATDFVEYTSAGFFQFYPSPDAGADVYQPGSRYIAPISTRGSTRTMQPIGSGKYYWGFDRSTSDPFSYSGVTNGGLCVKAQNNSNVRVRNVNFPCGWWNTSGIIYDTYANTADDFCTKTFIWNISNNSTLHADHLSVSSAWPADVGYFGPSAVWFSGAGGSYGANYGAPSSTPDTSSLSVLDFYGLGLGNVWPLPDGTMATYGFGSPQNQGPFRLYVGVDPAANTLQQDTRLGYVEQLFAQGYNTSGYLSAIDSASSVYGKVIRETPEGNLAVSGYYYSNEFVQMDPNSILLDESAANTFANAKNGALGTSNRPQICSIYASKTDATGESKSSSSSHFGSGFRSPNIFNINSEI